MTGAEPDCLAKQQRRSRGRETDCRVLDANFRLVAREERQSATILLQVFLTAVEA